MQQANKYIDKGPVEEISLPRKYRREGRGIPYETLIVLYDQVKRDLLIAMQRVQDANRNEWLIERQLHTQIERTELLQVEVFKLRKAGEYAVYGKPKLSTVDTSGEEEQT